MIDLKKSWNSGYGVSLTVAGFAAFIIIAIAYLTLQPDSITGWSWWLGLVIFCSVPNGMLYLIWRAHD